VINNLSKQIMYKSLPYAGIIQFKFYGSSIYAISAKSERFGTPRD